MNHDEQKLQIAVRQFLKLAHPDLLVFHPLNGGFALDKRQGAKFKAMGVLAGIPDLCFILPGKPAHWIELKAPKGSLSEEQATVICALRARGCPVAICRSLGAVEETLIEWGLTSRVKLT